MTIINLHVGCAIVSVGFFLVRAGWMIQRSALLQRLWVRVAPHVVDTVLFVTGVLLAQRVEWPSWLIVKLAAVISYIIFGALALRRAPSRQLQLASLVVALVSVAYVISVALTRSATPWSA